jgi:IS1 family transposase
MRGMLKEEEKKVALEKTLDRIIRANNVYEVLGKTENDFKDTKDLTTAIKSLIKKEILKCHPDRNQEYPDLLVKMRKATGVLGKYLDNPFPKNISPKKTTVTPTQEQIFSQFQSTKTISKKIYSDPIENNLLRGIKNSSILNFIKKATELYAYPQLSAHSGGLILTLSIFLSDLRYVLNQDRKESALLKDQRFINANFWIPLIELLFKQKCYTNLHTLLKIFYDDKKFIAYLWKNVLDTLVLHALMKKDDQTIINILMLLQPSYVEIIKPEYKERYLTLVTKIKRRNTLITQEEKHFNTLIRFFQSKDTPHSPQVTQNTQGSWWEYCNCPCWSRRWLRCV